MSRIKIPMSARIKPVTIGVMAAVVVGGVAAASPASAGSGAGTSPTSAPAAATRNLSPSVLKERVSLRIDRMVAAVDRVSAGVPNDKDLTPAEKATAQTDLSAARRGPTELRAKVDAETTVSAIKGDLKSARSAIKSNTTFEQAALLVRGANGEAFINTIEARIARIQAKISAAKAAGKKRHDYPGDAQRDAGQSQ
jgi:hypothetical protein